jgi:hypothetical protein
MIAELERDLRTPRIDRLHLTDQFNAALGHYPRVGLLGWHYSVLFLGLPWLLATSPDRARAVVAHELAHLSRKHDWTTRLVWRARASAERVQTELAAAYHPSLFLTARFFNWYRPALERRAMAQSRAQEFEADRLAAEAAGFDRVGQALLELSICDDLLDDQFWPDIGRRYQRGETCPENIFQELRRFLAAGLDLSSAEGRLEATLTERSNPWSSHPSLADRLAALGVRPQVPALRPTASAASCFLKDRLDHYLGRLSAEWQKRCAADWEAQAQRMREARTELSVLERTMATRALETRELAGLAELRELLHGSGAGIRQDLELLERDPDHVFACWRMARAALEAGDAGGLQLMLRTMQLEWQAIPAGISAIRDAAVRATIEPTPELEHRLEQLAKAYDAAVIELSDTTRFDLLEPHGLDTATVRRLTDLIRGLPRIRLAFLVRRRLKSAPDISGLVLAVTTEAHWTSVLFITDFGADRRLLQELADRADLSDFTIVLSLTGNRPLMNKIKHVPGALLI